MEDIQETVVKGLIGIGLDVLQIFSVGIDDLAVVTASDDPQTQYSCYNDSQDGQDQIWHEQAVVKLPLAKICFG